jgi:hypothetical protein
LHQQWQDGQAPSLNESPEDYAERRKVYRDEKK